MTSIEKWVPPQATDIERTVLGSMLVDRSATEIAIGILTEDCFYSSANRKVFLCVLELFEQSAPIDIVTVIQHLKKKNWLDDVGGEAYLAEIAEALATSGNVEYYSKILRHKAILRALITTAGEIHRLCFDHDLEPEDVLEMAQTMVYDVGVKNGALQPIFTAADMVRHTYSEFERVSKGGSVGISTGFKSIDDVVIGFCRPEVTIIAGRPGMGKTAFAMSLMMQQAIVHRIPILFFSIEMSQLGLGQRAFSIESGIGIYKIRTARVRQEDILKVSEAASRISEAPFYGCDIPGITLNQIRSISKMAIRRYGIEAIYIDHTRLMGSKTKDAIARMTEISHGLKNFAKEIDRPIIPLHQLSRPMKGKKIYKPQLSDLRDSGAVEEDADGVMFVHREFYYTKKEEDRHKAEIIIAKQRNGPIGEVSMKWTAENTQFSELSPAEEW